MEWWQIGVAAYIAANLIILAIINHFNPIDDGTAGKEIVFFSVVIFTFALIPIILVCFLPKTIIETLRFLKRMI